MIDLKNAMHTRCSSMQNNDYKSKNLLNQILASIMNYVTPPPISNNSIKAGGGGGELSVSSCTDIYIIGDTPPPQTPTCSII